MQTAMLPTANNPLLPDAGSLVLVALVMTVPALLVYVWTALALSRVYAKLGVDGWKAWVPVYNLAVLLGLGGFSGWLLLLYLIPVFGAIFVYVAIVTSAHRINVAFGHGAGMTVLAALVFPVWASVLGFGGAAPAPVRSSYDPVHDEDAAAALRALAPESGRPALHEPLFDARREVLPPSAWIPAAPEAAQPAPAPAPVAPEPVHPAPAAAPAWAPPSAQAAAPAAAPETVALPVVPQPVAPEPAPVTSWWMPAPEDAAPPAPVPPAAADPAPVVVPAPPAPPAPPADPAPATPPMLRGAYLPESDAFPEESGAVSAVAGSPTAGAPRAAASAVSAFRPGIGDIEDDTFIAARKRALWSLELPDGTAVDLTGEAAVLGRRPVPVHSAPGAQLITVEEETRTVSKTHALLRRQGETWTISDLASTNGVMVDETEVEPGQSVALDGAFLLGDATLRLARRTP